MNKLIIVVSALLFSTLTFAASNIEKIKHSQPGLDKIATISIRGASSPSDAEHKLAEKAEKMGATKYRVISTTGNENIRGSAEIYR